MYYISEIFQSIQGEGNCAGANSLFVRFQHCNLSCSWCDTKFTWHKNDKLQAFTADEVKAMIAQSTAPNVILTGGEPTLYALDKIVVEGKKYHIETNGTIIPTNPVDITLKDGSRFAREAMDEAVIEKFNWVVSPKMNNAGQELNDKAMRFFAGKRWGIFKFIIQNKNEIAEITTVSKKYTIDKSRIYIGLEGCTSQSQLQPDVVDEIVQQGYNFSPRLHVLLWGNKRER